MRLKFIIGTLICLISLTNTALAIDLNVANEPGATSVQKVVVSVSGNEATFIVTPLKNLETSDPDDYYPQGWFDLVGLPSGLTIDITDPYSVTDVNGNPISGYKYKEDDNIGGGFTDENGVQLDFTTAKLPRPGANQDIFTTIHVKFSGTPETSYYGAHVAWGVNVNGMSTSSAKFSNGNVEVPEFPTMALPVAAILGLMFIFGRKKQE